VQVRRPPGGDIADEEWRTLATLCIGSVMQGRRNGHRADRSSAARVCRGGEDAVNQTRRPVRFERCKMRIKIHPFGLALLLINVRNPH
jgi:hypothetical protein